MSERRGGKEREQTENEREKRKRKQRWRVKSRHHSKNSKALKGIDTNVSSELRGRLSGTEMLREKGGGGDGTPEVP